METMIDLGKMVPDYGEPVAVSSEPKKKKKSYPSTYIPLDMIRGKSIGDMCRFEVIVKVVGMNEREGQEAEGQIELHRAKYLGKAGKASREEYIPMSADERERYDKDKLENGDEGEEE